MKKEIILTIALLGLLFLSGCRGVCHVREENRLQTIEIYNCHVKICSSYNLEPYTQTKLDKNSCASTFNFIDEVLSTDKKKVVKCWNPDEPESVIQLSFTNVLIGCSN